jgi:hypothetical protein
MELGFSHYTDLATIWKAQKTRFHIGEAKDNFLFLEACIPLVKPTHPPREWRLGVLSAGVKQPVRESDHCNASTADVENKWSYISTLIVRYSFIFQFTFTTKDIVRRHIYVYVID